MFHWLISASLVIVGICIPLEGAAMSFAGTYLSASKAAVLLLLMMGLLQYSLTREMPGGSKIFWVGLYAINIGVGAVYAFLKGAPVGTLLNHVLAYPGLFALVLLLGAMLRDQKLLDQFLVSLCIGMVLATLLAFLGVKSRIQAEDLQRLGGIAGNANEVAFHLCLTAAVALAYWFTARTYSVRMMAGLTVIYFLVCMVATVSRSGLLALAVMMFFWVFKFRRLDMLKYALPVLVLVPLILTVAAPEGASERFTSVEDSSARGRVIQVQVGLEAFASNPIIGVGPRRFIDFAQERGHRLVNTVHNMPLKLLSESGLLGLVPFIAIVVLSWRSLTRSYWISHHPRVRGDPGLKMIGLRAAFLQVGMAGMIVIAQFQPMIDDKLMWALFGCSTAVERITRDRLRAVLAATGEEAPGAGPENVPVPGYGTAQPQPAAPMYRT